MKVDIIVPAAGESVTEADIASWSKASGDYVEMDDVLLELETDKASMELNAEISGELTIVKDEGETVMVGEVIGFITPGEGTPSTTKDTGSSDVAASTVSTPAPASNSTPAPASNHYAKGHPSPAAANALNQAGISSSDVVGTGKNGRITKADAESAKATVGASPQPIPDAPASPAPDTLAPVGDRTDRREKMSRLRRTVAQRLVNAQHTQALLTTFNEVDLTEIMAIRKKYKENFKEKYNVNLGFMSFFTKATCDALQEFPIMNASVDGDHIVYHDYCDIGIAVASPKGLVVPVIRSADQLSFKGIESSIVGYAKKARAGQITLDDMDGGTFTITNGGTFGSMLSTPIVNFPQSAILGMHNIVKRPMVVGDEIKIRPMMYLAVSYDHRIIDGSDAVRFLVAIKERLEDPSRLLIGL
ncbi:MAG: 2-oxoglutarate dehydrogenase complex dihydrolipoyllysine-residue succinyltransferase [Candidatus Marinamargulisbacteria bacterium]